MPVGCLTRTPYGAYPEYHTSGDNPDFVTEEAMADIVGDALGRLSASWKRTGGT